MIRIDGLPFIGQEQVDAVRLMVLQSSSQAISGASFGPIPIEMVLQNQSLIDKVVGAGIYASESGTKLEIVRYDPEDIGSPYNIDQYDFRGVSGGAVLVARRADRITDHHSSRLPYRYTYACSGSTSGITMNCSDFEDYQPSPFG